MVRTFCSQLFFGTMASILAEVPWRKLMELHPIQLLKVFGIINSSRMTPGCGIFVWKTHEDQVINHQFCLKHNSQTNPCAVFTCFAPLQVGRWLSRMVGRKFHSSLRSSPFCQAMPGSFLWIYRVCAAQPEIFDVLPQTSSSFEDFQAMCFT